MMLPYSGKNRMTDRKHDSEKLKAPAFEDLRIKLYLEEMWNIISWRA
jgi:hypothetical protein